MRLLTKTWFIILTILIFCCPFSFAQTTKFLSTEDGLSNSFINQIYQDKRGFIWIATEDGLNKFDGIKFTVYKKTEGDSTSIKNNYVRCLFEDSSGNLWIGFINGLMKYDRTNDKFQDIKIFNENKPIIPHITSFIERKNGDIWLTSSGSGLFSIKKGTLKCQPETRLNERLCSQFLTTIYEDTRNRLWIGSENDGLNIYSPDKNEIKLYTTSAIPGQGITSNAISAIRENRQQEIFVGTLNGGLNKFSFNDSSIQFIPCEDGNKFLPVKTIIFDAQQRLFIGTDGRGMKIFNESKQILEAYEPFSTPFDFSKAKVHSLWEDKDGNLWAGIFQKGIFFIPGNTNGFKYYGYKSFRKNSIGSNCVMAIHKDKKGILWIGTDGDGLYAIDEKKQQTRHYENRNDQASVPNTILCIQETSDGKLWIGSYLNGFALFDPQTGECNYIRNDQSKYAFNRVYCMIDDGKGTLWIGTYGEGLIKFDIASQSILNHYYQVNEDDIRFTNNWINVLLLDEGKLWIGTYKGLSCLDTGSDKMLNYRMDNSKLPSNVIFALKKDEKGNLWIGTDAGLAYIDTKTNEFKSFSPKDNFSSNVICAIETGDEGSIWLSTLSGISKFSPDKDLITNYYTSDGLQGNEFSRGAHFKANDGEIFFGGINGITSFLSRDIHTKKKDLNVYITNFYLFGKQVSSGIKSGNKPIFEGDILDVSSFTLNSQDNVFSIDLSTLEYGNPERIYYRYQLKNFDVDWINTPPGNNHITYTNLNPGKYQLMFQACDRDNKSVIRFVEITILPPWYQTWWAKGIYLLILSLILYGIIIFIRSKIRHRNEMLRMEHADQINEAKLQFFINISHEIRTPMTLILGPLEKLLAENKDIETQKSYMLIYRNAQRILRLINQLMDIRKIDRGQMHLKLRETDMVGFISDIAQAFDYMSKKKNIHLEFIHEMPELKVWVDLNNFDKVLFNVYSNAFKYTPEGGEITTILTIGRDEEYPIPLKDFFEIKILDNGIGIDKDKIEKIFERFYQVDNGITNSNFGTGIGLHLSRSLVELQYGTIFAENREDGNGSCFTIRMPLGNDHLKKDEMEIITEQTPLATFAYSKKDNLFESTIDMDDLSQIKSRSKYKVLLVEDDPEISSYVLEELTPLYKMNHFPNGKDALEYILKEKPDLVVSDIMMPVMDGITLCRKIKSNINVNHIPVILLTAKSKEEDRAEGLDTGADAYIVKPFNPEILKKTIANLLENRERLKGKFQTQSEGKIEKIEIKSSNEILMEKVLKIINENIDNPELNVEMLSAGVGISRVHMHRKLKELTNQSARDFIRNIRLKQAGELLKSKKLSISEVAYAVGFSTLSHFSTSFRDFYGMSPKEYQDLNE